MNVGLGASVKNELWSVVAHQVRRAELVLLARSHSVVSVSSAAGVLGCDVATAAALLAQEGWTTVDKSEGFLAAPEKVGAFCDLLFLWSEANTIGRDDKGGRGKRRGAAGTALQLHCFPRKKSVKREETGENFLFLRNVGTAIMRVATTVYLVWFILIH